jgi:membrane fusion protein (multidrug efflux system)
MTDQGPTIEQEITEPPGPVPNEQGYPAPLPELVAPRRRWFRRPLPLLVTLVVAVIVLLVGIRYLRYAMTHESTDDAFVQAHVVAISPKVASYVSRVLVDDNQHVNQGDLLVELDPRDFEARLAQARANLEAAMAQHRAAASNTRVVETTSGAGVALAEAGLQTARRQVTGAHSLEAEARAKVVAAEADAVRAAADAKRYERVVRYGGVSRQGRDDAVAASRSATANLDAARKAEQAAADILRQMESQVAEAQARLASAKAAPEQVAYSRAQTEQAAAQIAQMKAAQRQAELELSYAKIYAPETGRITRKSVEPGDYVQVGQTLFSIVPDRFWVVANFKETQLRYMRPGQPATVHVDAYPDKPFKGHVDSIQAGSGAAFSLLPPENATGNYVKVVQRVPVKIVVDEAPDPSRVIGPGMSVVPEVKVR